MATASFGCGMASSFLGTENQPAAKSVSFSSVRYAGVPPGIPANCRALRVAACAVDSKPAGKKPRGIMRPMRISPEMQELVGEPEISRTQALKVIWAHIKQNNLQDPSDKRIIVCDEKLKKIFGGRESVRFLEISGLVTPHFL